MNNSLTIENTNVRIESLHQWRVYAGLLEGFPTDRKNLRILSDLPKDVKRYCGERKIHVIEPVQTPIPYEGRYPFGKPMELPPTVCVANLRRVGPARNMALDGSMLTVVWFQEEFAFPIDAAILEQLAVLPWSELAEDFKY